MQHKFWHFCDVTIIEQFVKWRTQVVLLRIPNPQPNQQILLESVRVRIRESFAAVRFWVDCSRVNIYLSGGGFQATLRTCVWPLLLTGLSADRTVQCWRARWRPVAAGWLMCPGLSGDCPRWLWPLHCCRAHGTLACGCVASVPARNDRLRRASSSHLPSTSGQALCSMAGVYKFIMPSRIRNRVRVHKFFSRIRPKPSAHEILRTVTTLDASPKGNDW